MICFEPTKFENVRTGGVSRGFRAYDDNAAAYCNNWDAIPDDDLDFLAKVIEDADDTVQAMLDYMQEHEKGCDIGGEWYEWHQISRLWIT